MNIRAKIFGSSKPDEPILRENGPKASTSEGFESIAVARDQIRRVNNRRGDRHRLSCETVRYTHDGKDGEAELINLSGGGAMLQGQFEMKPWDRVDLHLGEHGTIECAVRWAHDDRVGLEFAHETRLDCSADELGAVLRQIIARSFDAAHFAAAPKRDTAELQPSRAAVRDEQRHAPRHPLIWLGVLRHDQQSATVRVRNISGTGAMIETNEPIRVGCEAVLELNEAANVSATVQWIVGDQVGLRFHSPFDVQLLGRSKPQVAPSQWVRPAYLETKVVEPSDSPWDPRWNRLSLDEINEELEGFLKR